MNEIEIFYIKSNATDEVIFEQCKEIMNYWVDILSEARKNMMLQK